jgi:3-oxocholest-4-en-26-oyl-CoA dehydrogenase alpha subunit
MDFSSFDDIPRYTGFRARVLSFLDTELTPQVRAEVEARGDDHHPGFFSALGREGWIIPDFPADQGGAGLDFWEYEILDTELNAAGAPLINVSTTRMIFPSVQRFARGTVREQVIAEVVSGRTALTLGYTEPSGGSDIADARTRSRRQDDGSWIISGSKVYTTGAHHAKYTFILTTSNPEAKKGRGLTMFLLPLDLPGIQVDPIWTLGERTDTVFFGDVLVSDDYRLGEIDHGWSVLQGPLDAEHSIGDSGGGRHADIGILYQRRLALGLYHCLAWAADRGVSDDVHAARTVGEVALRIFLSGATRGLAARVGGAQNFIDGLDDLVALVADDALESVGRTPAGQLGELQRRAQVSTIYGGTVEVFRNLIARELGLPRPAYKQ